MEVNPRENIPIVKIANKIIFFNTELGKYYYFKFFKIFRSINGHIV